MNDTARELTLIMGVAMGVGFSTNSFGLTMAAIALMGMLSNIHYEIKHH